MVKSIITIFIACLLIAVGSVVEYKTINDSFNELEKTAIICKEKALDESLTTDDVLVLQNKWIKRKKQLHVWIPHNEIKEMELWIAECVQTTANEKYPDSAEKLEVVIELCQQIPKTFSVSWQNIL